MPVWVLLDFAIDVTASSQAASQAASHWGGTAYRNVILHSKQLSLGCV